MAIQKVFCNKTTVLTTNKWKVGHTCGASGLLSLEMAILMLSHQRPTSVPFVAYDSVSKDIWQNTCKCRKIWR